MKQKIVSFHLDDEHHWVARLACDHNQHVRHQPPWTDLLWVTTAKGRAEKIGFSLNCVKCDQGAPSDV